MENINQTCLILNKTVLERDMFVDYTKAFEDKLCWHKFIIKNVADLDKYTIINGFFKVIAPASLLPVKLKRDMFGSVEFIAKSCKAALEALVKKKLTISITHKNVTKEFSVDVLLQYCSIKTLTIDVDGILYEAIQSRFNASKHELNLERFHMEKELDSCYCPLSQPSLLRGIIHLSRVLKPRIIKLGKNEINAISNMKVFNNFPSIEEIDLRNNLIDDLSKIDALHSLNLKGIVLDGNPLCRKYANARDYVNEVKILFPTLLFLDNMALIGPPTKPINNFLCRFEGMSFVNSFMSSFFTAYDNSREALTPMYNQNAMFSLNINVESDEYKIFKFTDNSRNLLSFSARVKHQELLTLSQRKIFELFIKLPTTKHDVFSFKTDLLIFSGCLISFVVSGMFRETEEEEKTTSRCCTFTRHFVLRGINFTNYTIVNDMLNVSQITECAEDFSLFHHLDTSEMLPSTTNEIAILEDTFEKLSNLDTTWSKWYLEENEYDIIKSLHMLIRDINIGGVIPEAAFKPQVVGNENNNAVHISQISINMSFKGEMFESDDPIQFEECKITDSVTLDRDISIFMHDCLAKEKQLGGYVPTAFCLSVEPRSIMKSWMEDINLPN